MADILDGKSLATVIKEEVRDGVGKLAEKGVPAKLTAVLVGDDPGSVVYARAKEKACSGVGMAYELHHLPGSTAEAEVIGLVRRLNDDQTVHGILVEFPLPKHINKWRVLDALSPDKDVDGMTAVNRGRLLAGEEGLFPATPQSCIEIMERYGIEIAGKHAVLVGRGETVGRPLILMLLRRNATITVCHTKTVDLSQHTRRADILIAAAGRAGLITADMVKPGAVVVDAGINQTDKGIVGDVDFESVKEVAGRITPVPGGVGSLTTTLIMKNVLKAMALQGIG
ncbi:MAG: bifunctional 5,10-methylene-tetrahydrofolate dehydrogenase/5,10-methylene-tetrahydrofolate cyclohydrolase [Firmicutes bacterium]|nr:bifunctional 5,10-methylene-tetrahydrofolate dehydrogenase/5,10-methylene-tetrahydrofolate cyclohydrolase [Bacillota bacterium]